MTRLCTVLLVTTLLSGTADAQEDTENDRNKGHRGPPEVALEACSSLVHGDPCSFEGRREETVEGTCDGPDDKPLACRPEGGKREKLHNTA